MVWILQVNTLNVLTDQFLFKDIVWIEVIDYYAIDRRCCYIFFFVSLQLAFSLRNAWLRP